MKILITCLSIVCKRERDRDDPSFSQLNVSSIPTKTKNYIHQLQTYLPTYVVDLEEQPKVSGIQSNPLNQNKFQNISGGKAHRCLHYTLLDTYE